MVEITSLSQADTIVRTKASPTGALDSAASCSELGPTLHQQMRGAQTEDATVFLRPFPFPQHRHVAKTQAQTTLLIIQMRSAWLAFHF